MGCWLPQLKDGAGCVPGLKGTWESDRSTSHLALESVSRVIRDRLGDDSPSAQPWVALLGWVHFGSQALSRSLFRLVWRIWFRGRDRFLGLTGGTEAEKFQRVVKNAEFMGAVQLVL